MTQAAAQPIKDPYNVMAFLDLEILRAQMINCLQMAVGLFQKHNQGLSVALIFGKVSDMGVLFTMLNNHGEPRLYLFHVLNPDGTRAHLSRLDAAGAQLDLDNFDNGFLQAISGSLASTLSAAYRDMVKEPTTPTHPAVDTLQ